MIYQRKGSQVSYGEAVGILLLDSPVPFIPGDVANATSYAFPVRFKKVRGFSVKKALGRDERIYPELLRAAESLKANGVRAITGDCGFMALHQERLKKDLNMPVFLSSLLQIPFIRQILPGGQKIAVLTASKKNLTEPFLNAIGITGTGDLLLAGLEDSPEFSSAVLEEKGTLDPVKLQAEVLDKTDKLLETREPIGAFLLECSVLPPYAQAVADRTGLPVFDYMTMINYVFSALIRNRYHGYM